MKRLAILALAACLSIWTSADAQSLELQSPALTGNGTAPGSVTTSVGETVNLNVWARLDCLAVSGIDLHLSLPADAFTVLDRSPHQTGVQPFSDGPLFAGAVVVQNGISDVPEAVADGRLHLRYSAVTGPGLSRGLKGQGLVASFGVVALRPVDRVQVRIEDTPILETRLVLPDGTTERRFTSLAGLELSAEALADPLPTATPRASWGRVKRGQSP